MQNDSLILRKTSLTSFRETPLHISALLGHLDFTKALLNHKPGLAKELDSLKHSPLHLASAEDHVQTVKELLLANKDVCLVADRDGRIPLHLAAMRGRVEVVQELISAKLRLNSCEISWRYGFALVREIQSFGGSQNNAEIIAA